MKQSNGFGAALSLRASPRMLLWLTGYVRSQLERTLAVLGISVPEYM